MFSDPLCKYIEPTDGSSFNQTGGLESQSDVLRSSL